MAGGVFPFEPRTGSPARCVFREPTMKLRIFLILIVLALAAGVAYRVKTRRQQR